VNLGLAIWRPRSVPKGARAPKAASTRWPPAVSPGLSRIASARTHQIENLVRSAGQALPQRRIEDLPDEVRNGQMTFHCLRPLLATSLLASGCSVIFLKGPKANYGLHESVNCTSSYELPALDAAMAAASLASYVLLSATEDNSAITADTRGPGPKLSLLGMGLFGISSVFGFYEVGRCRGVLGGEAEIMPSAASAPQRPQRSTPSPPPPDGGASPADGMVSPQAVPQQVDDEDAPASARRRPLPSPP
jgi:hypothetical protein